MPEVQPVSWAEKIKQAQESSGDVKFEALELGRYNFKVAEARVKESAAGNQYISIQAKVLDGPRANAVAFQNVFPEAKNVSFYLEFYQALGLNLDWLINNNPTVEEQASAFKDRQFSAEVFVEDGAKIDQKTEAQYRSLRKYQPQAGAPAPTPQDASSAPGQGAPVATPQPQPQAPSGSENPWGNFNGQAPGMPFQN